MIKDFYFCLEEVESGEEIIKHFLKVLDLNYPFIVKFHSNHNEKHLISLSKNEEIISLD